MSGLASRDMVPSRAASTPGTVCGVGRLNEASEPIRSAKLCFDRGAANSGEAMSGSPSRKPGAAPISSSAQTLPLETMSHRADFSSRLGACASPVSDKLSIASAAQNAREAPVNLCIRIVSHRFKECRNTHYQAESNVSRSALKRELSRNSPSRSLCGAWQGVQRHGSATLIRLLRSTRPAGRDAELGLAGRGRQLPRRPHAVGAQRLRIGPQR